MASLIPAGKFVPLPGKSAEPISVPDVYLGYASFCAHAAALGRIDLAHQLILCEPLSAAGEAPLIAASIASAASLCIEPNPAIVRQAIRSGAIDFTVNNLDEALRALKNEIRKGLSIAVCLEGELQPVLSEMVERGVQPDIFCGGSAPQLSIFLERGARAINLANGHLAAGQTRTSWRVAPLPGKWLPLVDAVIAACLPIDDSIRRNWLKRAPRYLGRAMRMERHLPLTAEELEQCTAALRERGKDPEWAGLEVHFEPDPLPKAF